LARLAVQLHVPIRSVDATEERTPLSVARSGHVSGDEWGPGWPSRLPSQPHPRLFRRAPPLQAIALQASANDVLPGREPAARARDDMIQVQVASRLPDPTVLARVAVAHEDVVPTEPNLATGDAIKGDEEDHSRDANKSVHQTDGFAPDRRQFAPVTKVERSILFVYRFGYAAIEER
jgi:hypothetical protein